MPQEVQVHATSSQASIFGDREFGVFFFFKKIFFKFITFCRERETEHGQGKGQRERETQNQKQAPGSELSAQSPRQGSNPHTVRS